MTEQISKLLKDFLDELDDTMLREFKWYLGQHKERGSRPIQRSQLENTSRTETVDKLVQAYGAEGAVVTTVDVLYRMRLNDLATQLAQAIIDSDAEQREVGGAQPEAREQKPDEEQTLKAPKDLCCSICLSVFQTPVILQCGHSFCRTCVEKSWEGKVSRRCSLCDQLFTGAEPQVNFSLKNLSEHYMESHSQPTPAPQLPPSSVPIPPKKIREKQEDFERLRNTCTSLVARIERQSRTTNTKIKEEFKELRRYLKTEEANLLAALKREESQKIHLIQMIKETSRDALSLSDGVKKMEELATDASFLASFKSSLERTQKALLHPEPPQVQIEEAKYVENLQFRVLRKLLRITRNISGEPAASPRPQVAEVQPEVMLTVTCRYPGSSQSPPPQRLGGEDNVPKHHRRSRRLVQRDDPTARCSTCTCAVQHVHVVSPPE
ncbi:tripartite motif-containing protein 35-like isoform X1 [Takifugu rubripes]|uniref:tripartite motif-containing protein 35-like isoform X1 n=1 Tax=Takifugu rubripes TaxID=31033 RepID=UPI001145BCF0|nr:tripartite motif-containing protein 35-like isoform X1 [Takifugu rubripes]